MTPGFKKFLKWFIAVVAVLVLLLVLAIVFKNPILKSATCWNIKSNTGLDASIGKFDLSFANSRLDIRDFRIANTPAFGTSPLLDISEVYFAIAPQSSGKVRFSEVRFRLRELNVVQDTNGVTNLELLQKTLETNLLSSGHVQIKGVDFGGVDKLVVSLGKVNFTDLANPANNTQIDLGIKDEVARNLKTEEELQNWAMALLLRVAVQQSFNSGSRPSSSGLLERMLKQLK